MGYYSTATLPSAAQLRKSSQQYQVVPIQGGQPGSRAISEPRAGKQKLVAATSTLDRYQLQARSKSAERGAMKYRRVSLDPTYHQGYPGKTDFLNLTKKLTITLARQH